MRIAMTVCAVAIAAGACTKDKDATRTAPVAPAVDVALTSQGDAEVSLTDEKGNAVSARRVTGRVELPSGETIPLSPDGDGRVLRGAMGHKAAQQEHGCTAKVHITMPDGAQRTSSFDMCKEHAMHASAGHPAASGDAGAMGTAGGPMEMRDMGTAMKDMGGKMKDMGMSDMGEDMMEMGGMMEMCCMGGGGMGGGGMGGGSMGGGSMGGGGDAGMAKAPDRPDAKKMGAHMKEMGAHMKEIAMTMKSGDAMAKDPSEMKKLGAHMKDMGAHMKEMAGKMTDSTSGMDPEALTELGNAMIEMGGAMEAGAGSDDPMPMPDSKPSTKPDPPSMPDHGDM